MVYVINKNGQQLMPCTSTIARLLLQQDKAKCIKRTPFIIKLLYDATNYTQELTLGIDTGSGNIGSTNVKRVAGSKVALITQLCDMLKGLLPVGTILWLQYSNFFTFPDSYVYMIALAAILGHNFSIFLKFKGGKGVNTTLGASILLSPVPVLVAILVYYLLKWKTKYVSLGSICLSITLPVCELLIHKSSYQFWYFLLCATLIIIMHLPNIVRLINGNENKTI